MKKTKIIAMYLPQFHEIPENNKWWGEGFTEWVTVKKAESYYKWHNQPNVPLNNNYYNLNCADTIRWQSKIAKENGVYGWGIYHYWFKENKKLLEKPAEILLENKDIDMPFFFAWDNTSWIRTWSKLSGNDWSPRFDEKKEEENKSGMLIELDYGDVENWKIHFDYLLPFFKDSRYIKKNGKPIFMLYSNNSIDILKKMANYWNDLAVENGFQGIYFITRSSPFNKNVFLDGAFRYEPIFSGWQKGQIVRKLLKLNYKFSDNPSVYSYDKVWEKIIRSAKRCKEDNIYYGAFVNYDDTPRRGKRGKIIKDATADKFQKYLSTLVEICEYQNKEYIFLTAWNEWGEGAYLEPDEKNKMTFLKAIQNIENEREI